MERQRGILPPMTGKGLEGSVDSPTELRGLWSVHGSCRRSSTAPSFLCCFPILPAGGRGEPSGAWRRQPGPARRRRRGSRRRIPVLIWSWDSPGPAPAPGPRGDRGLHSSGGVGGYAGGGGGSRWLWGLAMGEGIPWCRPRSSPGPGTLPHFPPSVAEVN